MAPLPAVGKPAERALSAAGYTSIEQLAGKSEKDLLALHGLGPRAVRILNEELARLGLAPIKAS